MAGIYIYNMKRSFRFVLVFALVFFNLPSQAQELIPANTATHIASQDGMWGNLSTWQNASGQPATSLPGHGSIVHIPEGTMVHYHLNSLTHIFAIRIDGHFHVTAPNGMATKLKADIIYSTSSSHVEIVADQPVDGTIEIILSPFDIEGYKNNSPSWNAAALAHFEDGADVDKIDYAPAGDFRFNTLAEAQAAIGTSDETRLEENSRVPYDDGVGVTGRHSWDPDQLSIGLVTMGMLKIKGREKTTMSMLAADALRNSTSLSLNSAVTGWEANDEVLITMGGNLDASRNGNEVATLSSVSGQNLSLTTGLENNHEGRPADAFFNQKLHSYVGNLSRNIIIRSEFTGTTTSEDIHKRGHFMAMPPSHNHGGMDSGMSMMAHQTAISVENALFKDLGRTDKSRPLDDLLFSGWQAPMRENSKISSLGLEVALAAEAPDDEITNHRGRYSIHLHKTGSKKSDAMVTVKGNVVWGNPGWGITHHDSFADISNNIVYDVTGAGIVAESGSETGFWNNNLVVDIKRGHSLTPYEAGTYFNDWLFDGQGLALKGRAVMCDGNVIADANEGVGVFNMSMSTNSISHDRIDPTQLATVRPGLTFDQFPLNRNGYSKEGNGVLALEASLHVNNTTVIGANIGFKSIEREMGLNHESRSVFDGFYGWGVRQGFLINYQADYTFHDVYLSGFRSGQNSLGISMWKHSHNQVFDTIRFEDLNHAVQVSKLVPAGNLSYGFKFRNNGFTPWVFIDARSRNVGSFYELLHDDDNPDPDYTQHADNTILLKESEVEERDVTFTITSNADLSINYDGSDLKFLVDGIITDDLGSYNLGAKQAQAQGNLRLDFPERLYEFASVAKLDEFIADNGVFEHPTLGYKYILIQEWLPNRLTNEYKSFPIRVRIENAPTSGAFANPQFEPGSNFLPQPELLSHSGTTRQRSTQQGLTYSFKGNNIPIDPRSDKAIDGNVNGRVNALMLEPSPLETGSFIETETENKPFWEIDLGVICEIDHIDIWNTVIMNGSAQESNDPLFNDFYILISENPFTQNGLGPARTVASWERLVSFNSDVPRVFRESDINHSGRYIRIQKADNDSKLRLAEVEIIGTKPYDPITYVYEENNGMGAWTPRDPSNVATVKDHAIVRSGTATLTGDAEFATITIVSGASFDIENHNLSFAERFTTDSDLLAMDGTLSFIGESGILDVNEHNLVNLNMNAEGSLTLASNAKLSGKLTLEDGELVLDNHEFTILSDVLSTGYVTEVKNGSVTGNVTIEEYFPANRGFHLLASPVDMSQSLYENWQESGSNATGFGTHITGGSVANGFDQSPTNNPSAFYFDNAYSVAANSWIALPDTHNSTLDAGQAIRLLVRGDRTIDLSNSSSTATPTRLRSKGALKTGNITENIPATSPGNFALIGNPYQALVDATQVLTPSNSEDINPNFFWVWAPEISNYIVYSTITGGVQSGVDQNIRPGQSFFVLTELSDVSFMMNQVGFAPQVNFKESFKTVEGNPSFINDTLVSLTVSLLRNGIEKDNVRQFYFNNASNGLDSYDAPKLNGMDERLAILSNGSSLSVESRSPVVMGESIDLNLSNTVDTNYEFLIELPDLGNVPAYLYDRHLDQFTMLTLGTNSISFDISSSQNGSGRNDRFSIVFDDVTLGVDDSAFAKAILLYPNPVDEVLNWTCHADLKGDSCTVTIVNLLGQTVHHDIESIADQVNRIDLSYLQSGSYYLTIETDSSRIVKRFIKK